MIAPFVLAGLGLLVRHQREGAQHAREKYRTRVVIAALLDRTEYLGIAGPAQRVHLPFPSMLFSTEPARDRRRCVSNS